MDDPLIQVVKEEENQFHPTRKKLYQKIERLLGVPVISFCTSFLYPVMIEDTDAEMLEAILRECDLSKGVALLINSPGGSGLAAERIIRIFRSYSGSGEYLAIVPGKAKSAATMVCLGASSIIMGKTAELGPVDPQIAISEGKKTIRFSVYNLVKSYEHLFDKAVRCDGKIEPYLQQLGNYDEREIAEYKAALALSDDIAIRALKGCMMKNLTESEIKEKIGVFLIPEGRTKVHGRPIYADEALSCSLKVDTKPVDDKLFSLLYELYIRANNFVTINNNSKLIECCGKSYYAKYKGE